MALVSTGWWVTVTVADNGNNRGSLDFETNPATVTDYTTALAAAADLMSKLGDLINGVYAAYSVAERYRENALVLPASGVELNTKASLSIAKASDGLTANMKIPTPTPTAGVVFIDASGGGANIVNTTSTFLATYLDLFRTGGTFLFSDGEIAGQLLKGKRIGAKSNNG